MTDTNEQIKECEQKIRLLEDEVQTMRREIDLAYERRDQEAMSKLQGIYDPTWRLVEAERSRLVTLKKVSQENMTVDELKTWLAERREAL